MEGRHLWGLGRGTLPGEMGLCCNMMFILVMYLTVEDNKGLSVWLYEQKLEYKYQNIRWQTFKRNLVMEKTYIYGGEKKL